MVLEVDYSPEYPKPFYQTRFKEIDSIDFSIIFHFVNGTHAEIYWDGQFFQYGIGLRINKASEFSGYKKWNVTGNELWKKYIEHSIIGTEITWDSVTTNAENTMKEEHFVFPQDLKVEFSNSMTIFISAAAFINENEDKAYGFMDNLLVTDNEALARKMNITL